MPTITIKVSPEEKVAVARAAGSAGMSAYIRSRVPELGGASPDLEDAVEAMRADFERRIGALEEMAGL